MLTSAFLDDEGHVGSKELVVCRVLHCIFRNGFLFCQVACPWHGNSDMGTPADGVLTHVIDMGTHIIEHPCHPSAP